MVYLPQEVIKEILEYLPREDLKKVRQAQRSLLDHGTRLLFRHVLCCLHKPHKPHKPGNNIILIGQDPNLRSFVKQVTFYSSFLAAFDGGGDIQFVQNLMTLQNLRSVDILPPRDDETMNIDAEKKCVSTFHYLLGLFNSEEFANITEFGAKGLSRLDLQVNMHTWRKSWERLTALELHFSDLHLKSVIGASYSRSLLTYQNENLWTPIANMLSEAISLRRLRLSFDRMHATEEIYQPGLGGLFSECKKFPPLQELGFRGIYAEGEDFQNLLSLFKTTLQILEVQNITFLPVPKNPHKFTIATAEQTSPIALIKFLGERMSLESCKFSGYLRDRTGLGGLSHLPNRGMVMGMPVTAGGDEEEYGNRLHVLSSSGQCIRADCSGCLMVRIQRYITHRGSEPFPFMGCPGFNEEQQVADGPSALWSGFDESWEEEDNRDDEEEYSDDNDGEGDEDEDEAEDEEESWY